MKLNIKEINRCSSMHSLFCAAFFTLGTLHNYGVVEALSTSSSSSKHSNLSELDTSDSSSRPESSTSSRVISSSTSFSASVGREYWTAFINISYLVYTHNDSSKPDTYHTEDSETGRYSTSFNRDVQGIAVEMISTQASLKQDNNSLREDGNITGCKPPFIDNYPHNESWIAVVKRGGCTFNEKVKNALDLNASAILVYDNENNQILQSMKVEEHYHIPSVFTYYWKGKQIINLINRGHSVRLSLKRASHCRADVPNMPGHSPSVQLCIQADEYPHFRDMMGGKQSPFWNWATGRINGTNSHRQKRTSVLFVSVSFIILMLISLAWLIFYYVQRFRYIHAKDQLERKLCSQAKRALQIISTSVLKKDDLEAKDFFDTCAVCIENYRVEDIVRILPCKHQFHKSCIDQWLLEKRTCPMCKMDILKHYGLVTEKKSKKKDERISSSEPHEETSMNQLA